MLLVKRDSNSIHWQITRQKKEPKNGFPFLRIHINVIPNRLNFVTLQCIRETRYLKVFSVDPSEYR